MTLVPTDKNKDISKKCEELWNKIRGLIGSKTNNSGNYDKKYVKIKFISDDNLIPRETLELH